MNTFPFDTDEYYLVCCKVSDSKTFLETLYLYYLMFANHHVYYRLARLTWTFKNVLDPFHLQRNKLYRKYRPVRIPKKNNCWYGTQKLPKNLNIYLWNYQTETTIFLATKHEKTSMTCNYLNFSIHKIHQNSKKWWLLWIWCQCFWDSTKD